jgi:hypothetical protein
VRTTPREVRLALASGLTEAGEHDEVGVERDALDASDADLIRP